MSQRFFDPQTFTIGETVTLSDDVAHHIGTVLRKTAGQEIILFNGQGGEYSSELIESTRKHVTAKIHSFNNINRESNLHIHLGQTLSKGDRFEYALQKATEMGANEITPLFSEHCDVKLPTERWLKKEVSWRKLLISACEQSGRTSIPILHPPIQLLTWAEQTQSDLKIVLHTKSDQEKLSTATEVSSMCFVIGPEGGFSASEISHLKQYTFTTLNLGPRILRTETAPIAAISWAQLQHGDWQ